MIHLFNTLSGRKEEFVPLEPGVVRMYVCGDTVYDFCHVGHARSKIAFDIVRRYLDYRDFKVARILKLRNTETPFQKHDHIELDSYMKMLPVDY